ncbi:MAG: methylated-DNA--[protein]-cysteine S-methyltransferase [Acidovorax sp.]|uniref:methylated-DNA--[protein]-cysteine S-methyltransferase n=1 Tax=Acidovorax sp. TaxID=1872122 RepID=UPI00391C6B1B
MVSLAASAHPVPGSAWGHGHALFDTAIGTCGIAWGPGGIVAVQLPEADAQATQARLLRGLSPCCAGSAESPPAVRSAIEGIQALLTGQPRDLCEVPLDMSGISPFHQQVYAIARAIPPGSTRTYGEVAEQIGSKGLSRAVGQALGLNPFAPVVPCHRVLAAGDKPGGFSAGGGALTKLRLLQIEGACPGGTLPLF